MSRPLVWCRRVLALAMALGVSVPATALASDRAPTPTTSTLRASVERVATTETHRLVKDHARANQTQSGQTGNAKLESGSFFKSPAGVAVLAAFGVGLGYALYSASNDRIRSSGR